MTDLRRPRPRRTSSSTTARPGTSGAGPCASASVQARTWTIVGDEQLVDEAIRVVDDEEPTVLGHAALGDRDLVASFEPEAHDRGDVQVGDGSAWRDASGRAWPRRRASLADAARDRPSRHRLRGPGRGGGRSGARARPACRPAAADTRRSGTFNRLVWLGDTYLELIGVFDRALAERSWIGGPTVRALDAGGGLATWAVATDDIDGDVARLNDGRRRPGRADRRRAPATRRQRSSGGGCPSRESWVLSDRRSSSSTTRPPPSGRRPTERREPRRSTRSAAPSDSRPWSCRSTDMPGTIATLMRTVRIGPFRPSLAGGGARDTAVGSQTLRLRPLPAIGGDRDWPVATIHLVVDAADRAADRRARRMPVRRRAGHVTRPDAAVRQGALGARRAERRDPRGARCLRAGPRDAHRRGPRAARPVPRRRTRASPGAWRPWAA